MWITSSTQEMIPLPSFSPLLCYQTNSHCFHVDPIIYTARQEPDSSFPILLHSCYGPLALEKYHSKLVRRIKILFVGISSLRQPTCCLDSAYTNIVILLVKHHGKLVCCIGASIDTISSLRQPTCSIDESLRAQSRRRFASSAIQDTIRIIINITIEQPHGNYAHFTIEGEVERPSNAILTLEVSSSLIRNLKENLK